MLNELRNKIIDGQYRIVRGTWLSDNRLLWNCDGFHTQTQKRVTVLFLAEELDANYSDFYAFLKAQNSIKVIKAGSYSEGKNFYRYIILQLVEEKVLLNIEKRWAGEIGEHDIEQPIETGTSTTGPVPAPRQNKMLLALSIGFILVFLVCIAILIMNKDTIVSVFITPTPTPTMTPTTTPTFTPTITPTPALTPTTTPTTTIGAFIFPNIELMSEVRNWVDLRLRYL